jgi:hypothetical protein
MKAGDIVQLEGSSVKVKLVQELDVYDDCFPHWEIEPILLEDTWAIPQIVVIDGHCYPCFPNCNDVIGQRGYN